MQTLSYGYSLPETNDKGTIVFPALEDNIQQLNDHSHNGVNSAALTTTSVAAVTQAISAASWASQGGGTYRQTVTMPAGITYAAVHIAMKLTTLGHVIYPTIEKVGASSYYVYTNDNTLDFTAVYV